jgi:hypothetical protein
MRTGAIGFNGTPRDALVRLAWRPRNFVEARAPEEISVIQR